MMAVTHTQKADSLRVRLFFVFLQTMRKNMRLYRIFGLAVVLAALTQCAVQEPEGLRAPAAGASFEVYARTAGTKTVNDGLSTLWLNGDAFSLFHAVAGTQSYVSDGTFLIDEPETGHATGPEVALGDGPHDWFLTYPASADAGTPAAVPVTVGAAAGVPQVQAGADSRAHLAGDSFPLGGRRLAVPGGETPVLTVAPLLAVIAVHVSNPGAGSVLVRSVGFKASEAIAGSFLVDVTGEQPVFQEVDATDEAVLSVEGYSRIKAGESAVFYLGIKPFTARAGSTLVLTVNDYERAVTLSQAVTFSAGVIKKLNIVLPESEKDPVSYFKRTSTVISGRKYIFVAEDTRQDNILQLAHPLPAGTGSGNLEVETVTEAEPDIIVLDSPDNAFTFIRSENGYLIRQPDGRYLYNNNQDKVFAGTESNSGYYWTVTSDDDGLADIVNRNRRFQYNPSTSIRKFQFRQTTSSIGINPRLYELQNDEEATAVFLSKTAPGVYDYGGNTWVYEDGTWQTSVRTLGGVEAFRLYHPSDYTVVQVTGIPALPAVNDRFTVRLVRFVKQVATHADNISVTVLKVEDGTAWLMGDGGTGFIVKIQ